MVRSGSRILLAVLAVVGLLAFLGCGSGSSSSSTGSTTGSPAAGTGANSIQPGQTLYARIQLMPIVPIGNPIVQATLVAQRNLVNALGSPRLAADGSMLVWPPSPGSSWIVEVGDQKLLANGDGSFRILAPSDLTLRGTLASPHGGFTPVEFSLAGLSPDPDNPTVITIPLPFRGPCGMSEGDTDEFCAPPTFAPALTRNLADVRGRYLPPDYVAGSKGPGVVRGRLGTYPPTDYRPAGCPDKDGPIQDGDVRFGLAKPVLDELAQRAGRSVKDLFAYLGSTCDKNVLDGACINENPISNVEYKLFVDNPRLVENLRATFPGIVSADAAYFLPSSAVVSDETCLKVHKNRTCSEFLIGDLALDVDGTVVKSQHDLFVKPGDTGTFIVHNNGIFGITVIEQQIGEKTVTLDPNPLGSTQGDGGEVRPPLQLVAKNTAILRHYFVKPGTENSLANPYQTDQTLRYRVSADAKEDDESVLSFTVDDKTVQLHFVVAKAIVKVTPPDAVLGRGDSRSFTAALDHPPAGQIVYEWDLDRHAGTLSATTGSTVVYTAGGGEVDSPLDRILVAAFLVEGTERRLLGRGSAGINISGVHVNPATASLTPGSSQSFAAEVTGLPSNAVLTYQWSVPDGFGTLSSPDQPSVVYTVKPNVAVPQNGTLKLTVLIGEGAQQSKLGETTVPITIFRAGTHKVLVSSFEFNPKTFEEFILIHSFFFDPSSGQLSPAATVPLRFPSLDSGDGRLTLRPDCKVGFLPRYSASTEVSVEVFGIDPASGDLSNVTTITGPDLGLAIASGQNSLYLSQTAPSAPILRYALDAAGNPSPTAFTVPGDATREMFLLRDDAGLDLALFARRVNQFFGFRVGSGLTTAEAVGGSPFTPPNNRGLTALHPNKRFLLYAQKKDLGGGEDRLDCIEINPSNGDFLGLRGTIRFLDTESPTSLSVNADGLAVLGIGDHATSVRVDVNGSLTRLLDYPGPWDGVFSSMGDYLFGGGTPNAITTYRVNSTTGALTQVDVDSVDSPQSVAVGP